MNMKSSTEITTKVLAATLLTGFFNLSQVEACEGNRVNHVKEFKYVVAAAGVESALNLPADFAKRDERKKISEPLSPVGRMSMSNLPERKGSSTLIRGNMAKLCYVLTSLHLLPNGEGVSAVTNEAYPNLLGKSFAELKNENLDQVVFRIGSKFEKAINGEIVGGEKLLRYLSRLTRGQSTLLNMQSRLPKIGVFGPFEPTSRCKIRKAYQIKP